MKKIKNPLMASCFVLSVFSLVITFFVFNNLPDQIPIHWNASGEIDNYGSRYFAFFTALLPLLLLGLFFVIPRIDPKKEAFYKHSKAYSVFMLILTLFMIFLHWSTLFAALGYNISIDRVIPIGVGILFIILGNYMPQIRRNYTFGIRVPWAIDNEDNWRATHRFGAYCFILAGFLMLIDGFIDHTFTTYFVTIGIFICVFAPMVYSYIYFRKQNSKK